MQGWTGVELVVVGATVDVEVEVDVDVTDVDVDVDVTDVVVVCANAGPGTNVVAATSATRIDLPGRLMGFRLSPQSWRHSTPRPQLGPYL